MLLRMVLDRINRPAYSSQPMTVKSGLRALSRPAIGALPGSHRARLFPGHCLIGAKDSEDGSGQWTLVTA